jgi:hypothetical protein
MASYYVEFDGASEMATLTANDDVEALTEIKKVYSERPVIAVYVRRLSAVFDTVFEDSDATPWPTRNIESF